MYGQYDRSLGPKTLLTVAHLTAVAAAAWLLVGDGLAWISARTPLALAPGDALRRWLLVGAATVYFLRVCLTTFYLIRRRMDWSEAVTIGVWVWIIHPALALLGGSNAAQAGWGVSVGVVLYAAGSFLNTGSEALRHRWKQDPRHRGRLYTGGLFAYAMHINYFGDMVLFAGYALIAGRVWAFAIPALICALFVFVNIPMLDRYLAGRYAGEFPAYARRTKKLVPFVY